MIDCDCECHPGLALEEECCGLCDIGPCVPGCGCEDDLYSDPSTFEDVFEGIFTEAFDLLVERQRKYGPDNIRQLGTFGVFGRLADDKVERIRRAMNGTITHGRVELEDVEKFADESFEDALFDIANYALIIIALGRGLWGKPLA
jgi:hypothetical protein